MINRITGKQESAPDPNTGDFRPYISQNVSFQALYEALVLQGFNPLEACVYILKIEVGLNPEEYSY